MTELTLLRNYGLSGVYCPWRVEDNNRTIAMFRDKERAEQFIHPSARPRPATGLVLADEAECAVTLTVREWCELERLATEHGAAGIAMIIDTNLTALEEATIGENGNNGHDH